MGEALAITQLTGLVMPGRGIATGVVRQLQRRIKEVLGADPFPGTLNIILDAPVLLKGGQVLDDKGKRIAIVAQIKDIPCLVYRWSGAPLHVVEVIAPVGLRHALSLRDGEKISIDVTPGHVKVPEKLNQKFWRLFYEGREKCYYDDVMHRLFVSRGIKFFHKFACQSKSAF